MSVARAAGLVSGTLGLGVLAGWYLDAQSMVRVLPSFPQMKCTTALGFILCGVGLLSAGRRPLATAAGGLVTLLGGLTLLDRVLGIDLGFDVVLVHLVRAGGDAAPVAAAAGLAFVLAGTAVLASGRTRPGRGASLYGSIAGTAVLATGAMETVSYAIGIRLASGPPPLTGMAVHTALGFVAVGTGIIAQAWPAPGDQATGRRARQAWIVGTGVVCATLLLSFAVLERQRVQTRELIQRETQVAVYDAAVRLQSAVLFLEHLAQRSQDVGGSTSDVAVAGAEAFDAIEWLEPSLEVRARGARADHPGPGPLDPVLEPRRREAAGSARALRGLAVSAPFTLPGRGRACLLCVPLEAGGFVVGVLRFEALLGQIAAALTPDSVVIVRSRDEEAYRRGGVAAEEPWLPGDAPIPVADFDWRLRIAPEAAALAEVRSKTIDATMVVGVLIALAIGVVVDVWQTDRRRTALLQSVKGALEGEVVERRAAQAALKAANQDLEEKARALVGSNADLEQFAYLASHDLQEPLRMVGSYAGLFVRRYQGRLDPDADELAGHIMDGVARMRTLIDDLLAYSRAGTLRERPGFTDSATALTLALRNLESTIGEAGAAVTHDELPTVAAHDTELVQLFQNLIGNAVKFRSAAPPRVHVSAGHRDGEWRFAVRDNGIGMDPRYGERIFGLFQRLHRRNEYGGTGIGLAICRRIVDRRGGRIWVESTPGCGATFFFTLPAAEAAPAVTLAGAQTGGPWKAA